MRVGSRLPREQAPAVRRWPITREWAVPFQERWWDGGRGRLNNLFMPSERNACFAKPKQLN